MFWNKGGSQLGISNQFEFSAIKNAINETNRHSNQHYSYPVPTLHWLLHRRNAWKR